ncbi:MAG: hypothetical protein R3286_03315 [Gammaproteobacteria bacterium]|nr:hypothetical protein [Gammaproteobacteria bacterium]
MAPVARAAPPGLPMESVYFLITAVVLYFAADALLQRAETAAGRRFEHRTLIFFAILLTLALVSFALIRYLTSAN